MKPEAKKNPNLRFPEFKGDLVGLPLSEVVLEHNSGVYKNTTRYGSGVNIVGVSDLYSISSIDGQAFNRVPLTDEEISKFTLHQGDLVYGESSLVREGIAKTLYVTAKGAGTAFEWHTRRFKVDLTAVIPSYVHYNLESPATRRRIMRVATQTALTGITTKDYFATRIYLPSKSEQQKTAGFLSAVDQKIEHFARKKKLLLKHKKGLIQQIFDRKIRFKDDAGDDFPDWNEASLGSLCKVYDGTHMTPDYQESGIPFFSVEHVTANNFSETKFISEEVFEKENRRVRLEKGDILMTRIGDIGTSKYLSWDVKASFYVSLALIKQSSKINPIYLDQFMKSELFQRELHRRTLHVAFPKKINLGEISECKILVPVPEEQEQIASFLSAIDETTELADQLLKKAKAFKRGLLQQMFV